MAQSYYDENTAVQVTFPEDWKIDAEDGSLSLLPSGGGIFSCFRLERLKWEGDETHAAAALTLHWESTRSGYSLVPPISFGRRGKVAFAEVVFREIYDGLQLRSKALIVPNPDGFIAVATASDDCWDSLAADFDKVFSSLLPPAEAPRPAPAPIPPGTGVMTLYGIPKQVPAALPQLLRECLARSPEVLQAYLVQAFTPKVDETPRLLLVVVLPQSCEKSLPFVQRDVNAAVEDLLPEGLRVISFSSGLVPGELTGSVRPVYAAGG